MVYKKYVYKRGKKHGPYYYHSYRSGDEIKKIYIGGKKEYSEWIKKRENERSSRESRTTPKRRNKAWVVISIFILSVIIAGVLIYYPPITGKAILDIKDSYVSGEKISGNLILNLKSGELLPIDSKLIIEQEGAKIEIPLSEIISSNAEGDFYFENQQISGKGSGYGFIGKKTSYPKVFFTLETYDSNEKPTEAPAEEANKDIEKVNETIEEKAEEATKEISEGKKEESIEKPVEEAKKEEKKTKEETVEQPVTEKSFEPSPEEPVSEEVPAEEPGGESISITGKAVKEDRKVSFIDGSCSKDSPFAYTLENEKKAKIKSNSVKTEDGEKLKENAVTLQISDKTVGVSTEHSIKEEGFGKEYLIDKENSLEIPLSGFGILAQKGILKISLVYQDTILAEASKKINVLGEIKNITEKIKITTETQENITEGNITKANETITNITTNITIEPTNLTNLTEINETLLNITVINETIANETLSITTKRAKIIINKPVKWIKALNVNKSEITNLSLELPKQAENITIKTGQEVQQALQELEEYEQVIEQADKQDIVRGALTGYVSLDIERKQDFLTKFWNWLTGFRITGKVISEEEIQQDISETEESKIVDLTNIAKIEENIAVEYYTQAPEAVEEAIENGKRITISAPDELDYSDVLAYTQLNNEISIEEKDRIIIYWNNNETGSVIRQIVNFDAYDLDEDGMIDYIEWVVPHLSEQVYEIIYITKAVHLDENREFIEDIYEQVKEKDDLWNIIPAEHYVRVTFQMPLDNKRDITIYARSADNNSAEIEVYRENGNESIAKFENIQDEDWYKVYLSNLSENESYDTFDLKVMGDVEVEIDYIVDPSEYNFEDYKIVNYNNVLIGAEKVHSCRWKPDSINDGYKECSPEIIIWNKRATSIPIDVIKDNIDFSITRAYKNNRLNIFYSIDYEIYEEEKSNKTGSYNVSKIRFSNWKEFDGSQKSIPPNTMVGVRLEFELPQYSGASWNLTYKPLNMLLDPDISTCGTLNTAGTYILTADITDYEGYCFTITADNVVLDLNGHLVDGVWYYEGIFIDNRNNVTIKNGTLTNWFYGISLYSGSNNTLQSITASSNDYGIYLESSSNNTLQSITANSNYEGIYFYLSSNNQLTNITANSNNYGVYLISSSNNILTNIIADGNDDAGIWVTSSSNNILTNITTNSNNYGISLSSSLNNIVQNSNFLNSITNDVRLTTISTNNTFLNVSYDITKEYVDSGSELIRKWYYSANVTSSGAGINNAVVSIYNVSNIWMQNLTTGSNGLTGMAELTDYIHDGTLRVYYSNYTMNASATGYTTSSKQNNLTLSTNIYNDAFSLSSADTTAPNINIIYPANNTNSSDNTLDVNYTVSDLNLQSCWYSNDTLSANTTLENCVNITDVTWSEGQHNVTIWANDTSNNVNSSSVTFLIDTIKPSINITYPINGIVYSINVTGLNYTASDSGTGLSSCWYSVDNGVTNSTSVTAGINFTGLSGVNDANTWTLYCNDTVGNLNSSIVTFYSTYITNCTNLTQANQIYTLQNDILTNLLCFRIQANNITLDLGNNNITGDRGTPDYGVYSAGYNQTTITNGYIYNFSRGIYLSSNQNNNITNMTANSNSYGIYFSSNSNNSITSTTTNSNADGIYLSTSSNNTFTSVTANSNTRGITLSSSPNNVFTNITANLNNYGIALSLSSNNILTNITASSNGKTGISLSSSSNNSITNTIANSNYYGIQLAFSSNNSITNITANSNTYGIRLFYAGSNNNNFSSNSLSKNIYPFSMNYYTDDFNSNQFLANLYSLSNFSTASQEGSVGNRIDFNLTMNYANGSICPICPYKLDLYPSEASLANSSSNGLIIGNFTPTRVGIYSLRFNITDSNNNSEMRKHIYLINATGTNLANYYFRSQEPTHEQPLALGEADSGSLLFEKPTSEENRTCGGWVQFSPDVLPNYLFGIYKQINYSIWYQTTATATNWTGAERYVTYGDGIDYNVSVSATTKTLGTFNFSVNWVNDYIWTWYRMSIKLKGASPYIYSNSTDPSYANITYAYSDTPAIKEISNEDIDLLSATMSSNTSDYAEITLEGEGTTDISVLMPNTAKGYYIDYDGIDCSSNPNCTLNSQSNGEISLTLILGSTHTLEIYNDTTAPEVSLISPADGTSSTTTAYNFTFNVSDANNVDNCSLIIDNVNVGSITSVSKTSENGIYYSGLAVKTHIWSINCTDFANNIGNSTTRTLIVTSPPTTITPPSGGGGILAKTTIPGISTDTKQININLVSEAERERIIKITNDGTKEEVIYLSQENLNNIALFDLDSFKLAPGESKEVKIRFIAPKEPGIYTGKVYVGGNIILVSINVRTKELLFDVMINIPDGERIILAGEKLDAQITLIPMGEKPRLDVTLNYIIKDFNGRLYLTESETLLIEGQKSFKKQFYTGKLPVGDYILGLELIYAGGVATSSSHFSISEEVPLNIKLVLIVLAAGILILVALIILFTIRYKKHKDLLLKKRK